MCSILAAILCNLFSMAFRVNMGRTCLAMAAYQVRVTKGVRVIKG